MTEPAAVLRLPRCAINGAIIMPIISVHYRDEDRMPEYLERRAQELNITVEQLVKRYISDGMRNFDDKELTPGNGLQDLLVKNGVFKE